jgi:hypothetical protein
MSARQRFIRRHRAVAGASDQELLVAKGLEESAHNERARILRLGLAVELFCSLEAFLRERVGEVLSWACQGPLPFDDFPIGLRRAATTGAIDALAFQVRLRGSTDSDIVPFLQTEASAIASTAAAGFAFPGVVFGHSRSNLGVAEVGEFLESVGIAGDPWFQLTSFASRTGFGNFPLRDAYDQAYDVRNAAAHNAESDVEPQFLGDFHRSSLAIAISFDALLSRTARLLHESTKDLAGARKVQETEVRLRFLDRRATDWAERPQGAQRVFRVHRTPEPDLAACLNRARPKHEMVIVRDVSQIPTDWHVVDAP